MWTWFMLLRSGFSDRCLWTPWWKAHSCWTARATTAFLKTHFFWVVCLHTRTHSRARMHSPIDLSFGGAIIDKSVCVFCRSGRCVFRLPDPVRCSYMETSWLLFLKVNVSSFPRAMKLGQPSGSAVCKLLKLGSLFMLTSSITAWILLTLQTLSYKIHTVAMREITNFPRFQLFHDLYRV